MATRTYIAPAAHTQASGRHWLAAVAAKAWNGYWDYRANRAAVALLQSMDGQALHDIGINRSEIESVVYGRSRENVRR
jgi:uncharacterized protein YjiS (DUF1127 family)